MRMLEEAGILSSAMLSAPRRSCPIGSSWHFSSVFSLPNRRLKLAGGDRFRGNGVLCPWPGADCRPLLLRRLASRPQLKRDPLGGSPMTFGIPPERFVGAISSTLGILFLILEFREMSLALASED